MTFISSGPHFSGVTLTLYESEKKVKVLVTWPCQTFWNLMDCSLLGSSVQARGFSRQEYWSGLPFPSPGDLPNPGIGPWSPALKADSLLSEPPGKLITLYDLIFLLHEPLSWKPEEGQMCVLVCMCVCVCVWKLNSVFKHLIWASWTFLPIHLWELWTSHSCS